MAAGGPPAALPPLLALAPVRLELQHGAGVLRDAFAWPATASDADAAHFAARLVADSAMPPNLEGTAMRALAAAAASWRADAAAGRARRAAGPMMLAVRLDARAGRTRLRDTFLWDASDESADPEAFAQRLSDDLLATHAADGGDDDVARGGWQKDAAGLACEAALQIRELCAAAWRGAPAGVAAAAAAAAALAAAGGGGEAGAGRADWAEWAPRLDDLPPLPPPPPPDADRRGRKERKARPAVEEEQYSEQSEPRPKAASKKAKKATAPAAIPPPPPRATGGASGATSAVSLAQRSAAAAAQLGLGPLPPAAGFAQRLGSLQGPPPMFGIAQPQQWQPPPPMPPVPLQQGPNAFAQFAQQQPLNPHAQFLAMLSQAYTAEERASVLQALQSAKAAGQPALAQLVQRVRTIAEHRLATGFRVQS
jgi:hypothetical protein